MSVIQLASLLVQLEGKDDGFSKMLNQADKKVTSTTKKIGSLGSAMTKTLTAGVAAAATGLVALQKETGDYADTLLDLSDATGVTTDTLQRWRNVERSVGIETDRIAQSSQQLGERLAQVQAGTGPASEAFNKLGVSLFDSEGEMKNMSSLLPELLQGLGNIENATERNIVGTRVFGESWADLAPVIALGGDEFNRLAGEADNLGTVLSNDSLQAANEFRQEFVQVQAQLASIGRELAIHLMPMMKETFIPLVKDLVSSVGGWIDTLGDLEERTGIVSGVIKGLLIGAAIGPLLIIIPKVIAGVKLLAAGFGLLLTPIFAKIAALGAIVLALEYVRRNSRAFADFFGRLWIQIKNWVLDAVADMVDSLGYLISWIPGIEGPVAGLSEVIRGFKDEVPEKGDMTKFQSAGDFFGEVVGDMKRGLSNLTDMVFPKYKTELDDVGDSTDDLAKKTDDLAISFAKVPAAATLTGGQTPTIDPAKMQPIDMSESTQSMMDFSSALEGQITSSIVSFSDLLGNLFTGDIGADGFFNSILKIVGGFAQSFGKIVVAMGVAALQIKSNLLTNPIAAIAAGGVLIALGAALSNLASSGPGGGGGGGSVGSSGGPDVDLGTSFQGVTPGGRGQNGQTRVTGDFILEGDKLRAVIKNSETKELRARGIRG